jgi:hypothetical protein
MVGDGLHSAQLQFTPAVRGSMVGDGLHSTLVQLTLAITRAQRYYGRRWVA